MRIGTPNTVECVFFIHVFFKVSSSLFEYLNVKLSYYFSLKSSLRRHWYSPLCKWESSEDFFFFCMWVWFMWACTCEYVVACARAHSWRPVEGIGFIEIMHWDKASHWTWSSLFILAKLAATSIAAIHLCLHAPHPAGGLQAPWAMSGLLCGWKKIQLLHIVLCHLHRHCGVYTEACIHIHNKEINESFSFLKLTHRFSTGLLQ